MWHKSAPRRIVRQLEIGADGDGWTAWIEHLLGRELGAKHRKRSPVGVSPLQWALPESVSRSETPALLGRLHRLRVSPPRRGKRAPGQSIEDLLQKWLDEPAPSAADAGYALESLAWCGALPRLAGLVSPRLWWALLENLLATVADGDPLALDESPLVHQLTCGELALTLAADFPEIGPCRRLVKTARAKLTHGLIELLDGEGVIAGQHLDHLRPLLACWTRCGAIGKAWSKGCWSNPAQYQYEWFVRHALRMTRCDGSQVLGSGSAAAWCTELFEAALGQGGDHDDHGIAALVLPRAAKKQGKHASLSSLPEAPTESQWAQTAVLQTDWAPKSPRVAVVYNDHRVRIELNNDGHVLWSGDWRYDIHFDGRPLEPAGAWDQVCWVSDDDVDYLELEIDLAGGHRLQRHILLAREDRFLMLGDSLLLGQPGRIAYRGSLPLGHGVAFDAAEETHEGLLVAGRHLVPVLPLALPEWRTGRPIGSLAADGGVLELNQSTEGSAMFAPLFLDLRQNRITRPTTWRQLTIAQDREIVPADIAAGFRVAIGKKQWLIYRSLARRANRTLLGHNLSTEMLAGRFTRKGEVEPLLEIE